MRGMGLILDTSRFTANDFPSYHTYETNATKLERAVRLSRKLFDIWISLSKMVEKDTPLFYEILTQIEGAVQIGYESALNMPHKSSDYNLTPETLIGYNNVCKFCKHVYYTYGCEEGCNRKDKKLDCRLEVKKYLED